MLLLCVYITLSCTREGQVTCYVNGAMHEAAAERRLSCTSRASAADSDSTSFQINIFPKGLSQVRPFHRRIVGGRTLRAQHTQHELLLARPPHLYSINQTHTHKTAGGKAGRRISIRRTVHLCPAKKCL